MRTKSTGQKTGKQPNQPTRQEHGVGSTTHGTENPARRTHRMEAIVEKENMKRALKRVMANKGSPGVDGVAVEELPAFLKRWWPAIKADMLAGSYKPQPVRRVEIDKAGGGKRMLGIPTALDRLIQQATLQILQPDWDQTFSEHSYGFRPGRSAHQAVEQAQRYINEGYRTVVDMDLKAFFDRVNHDMLMGRVAKRESDRRLIKLIRSYLNAGVMLNGVVTRTEEGTPQGGPLSPLLANLLLDDLDKLLERRGHRFVRYADDCNIYVKSQRAGERVMASVKSFVEKKLKLQVNEEKSAVAAPWKRKFLGFTFTREKSARIHIAPKSVERFKERIRELTSRNWGVSLDRRMQELGQYLLGWRGYYRLCQTTKIFKDLESWIRRRLRSAIWVSWKTSRRRYEMLKKLKVNSDLAYSLVKSSHGPWRLSRTEAMHRALSNAWFRSRGLPSLLPKR